MGYDLHITRAFQAYESERFPILGAEVDELVRDGPDLAIPADAPRRPDFCYLLWTADPSDRGHYLLFQRGRLSIKHPEPAFLRRMIEWAARLDAWVIGDDAEVCEWDGERVVARQRGPGAFAGRRRFITRGTWLGGLNSQAPIRADEWAAVVAAQPDFSMATSVEAILPSGTRMIPCPAVACWNGHPSGRVVPFFFDEDVIEVRDADPLTERRMVELAVALGATAVDDDDQPV
ncbi:hypothetical protein AB0C29_34295 [Actinoplanes sp. NPDC048791]|uniref:hypothetical protein n=1 Tax=Actinoplanes sp. NPDC048791 TaxID=3154623 RepID=UPI0033E7B204